MNTFTKALTKTSQTLLFNSILWASLGFVVVGGLSIGYSFIMDTYFNNILQSQSYLIGASITSSLLMITAILLRMFWSFNVTNSSWTIIILNWIIYTFLYVGILAPLITLIDNSWIILIALCITGLAFILMATFGYSLMNTRFAISLSKVITIGFFAMLILQLIFLIPLYFYFTGFQVWNIIYQVVYTILLIGMISLCFYNISNSEYFYYDLDKKTKLKVSLFFGLTILNMFILLFRMILRLFLNFR